MDNYPDHLSPEFDQYGGISTPFNEWWGRTSAAFPHVPEEVARDWLHRHWRYSPFGWLPSAPYRFSRVMWPSEELSQIRSNWNDFGEDDQPAIDQGRYLAEDHRQKFGYDLAEWMTANQDFPVPPVIIDNRDGHLPYNFETYPANFLLVEGHRRFFMASYLAKVGRLKPFVPFWLMTRATV
jgi:hypothetical protein